VSGGRYLIVMADDFGIGPATSRAILDLAARGPVTATVLLVNSPYAPGALDAWRRSGTALEMGWHPNLTLDRPVAPPERVPSLVRADGSFYPLGQFLARLLLGRLRAAEVEVELRAQYQRFCDLVGGPPPCVNGHQHIHVFPPMAGILARLLGEQQPPPYVRRVRETWRVLARVPGARLKRAVLSTLGRRAAPLFDRAGTPGNDWLAGVTDPACVTDPAYFPRWLGQITGRVVELACHPGYWDETLIGRDCTAGDGKAQRRVDELHRMSQPDFPAACRGAGFTLAAPADLLAAGAGPARAASGPASCPERPREDAARGSHGPGTVHAHRGLSRVQRRESAAAVPPATHGSAGRPAGHLHDGGGLCR
jgi:predicted glycoside hydrolase/deacetylase ChbG (UPF0249 family)